MRKQGHEGESQIKTFLRLTVTKEVPWEEHVCFPNQPFSSQQGRTTFHFLGISYIKTKPTYFPALS